MTTDTKTVSHHHGSFRSFLAGVLVTSVFALGATAYNTNDKFHSSADKMMAQTSNFISDTTDKIKDKANETKSN